MKDRLKAIILQKHRHQFEGIKNNRSDSGFLLNAVKSFSKLNKISSGDFHYSSNHSIHEAEETTNTHFLKKIPKGAEAANILVGEVDFLTRPISVFIRMGKSVKLGDLTEVALPTNGKDSYKEVGCSIGTSFSDEVFHEVAYKSRT